MEFIIRTIVGNEVKREEYNDSSDISNAIDHVLQHWCDGLVFEDIILKAVSIICPRWDNILAAVSFVGKSNDYYFVSVNWFVSERHEINPGLHAELYQIDEVTRQVQLLHSEVLCKGKE